MTPDQSTETINSAPRRPGYVLVLPWALNIPGGVSNVVVNLYRQMAMGCEFEPLVFIEEWSALRPVENVIDGRRTVHMRLWPSWEDRSSIAGILKLVLASPIWMLNLLRLCRRHRVVAVNFHFPGITVISFALLRFLHLYRGALVVSFHGMDLRNAQETGRIERALWKFVLRHATAIVACSNALAADVRVFAGGAARRVSAIHNGLDVHHFLENVDRSSMLPATLRDRAFIVSVATWEWKKGLDVLLRAFAEVRSSHTAIALVLVGRSGGAESDLRALVAKLGIANDVLFARDVPHAQIGMYLEHAKVFCLPSRAEPFGIAILEAGAFRLPVVATRVGGIPEIVIDGESGLLVEPDNASALAEALGRVLSDGSLARALGERLQRRVLTDFTWKRAYKEYRALL